MAKNILTNTSYRKLDVDAYDPDQYDEAEDVDTPGLGPDDRQVSQLLQSNRTFEALKVSLLNPPLKSKNQAVKDKATTLVTKVLTSFKVNDIENAVTQLSDAEVELLLKYVYKAMELLADGQTCNILLSWHSQIFNRCGHGGIMRVFCERNH